MDTRKQFLDAANDCHEQCGKLQMLANLISGFDGESLWDNTLATLGIAIADAAHDIGQDVDVLYNFVKEKRHA